MQSTNVKNLSRGYIFHPGHSCFGYEQVDVMLAAKTTLEHFDPEKMRVNIGAGRSVQTLDIHHPWRMAHEYPVIAGRIILTDRVHKQVEVFTLGGQLTITSQPEQTCCTFTSEAPFLDLVTDHSVSTLLANEIEILLAERRAARNFRLSGEFDNLLLGIPPQTLYTVCLRAINEKFKVYHGFSDPVMQHFKHQLALEIDRLHREGLWPDTLPQLEDLI